MPVIGYLALGSSVSTATQLAAFRQGLGETGYFEGQNMAIDYRWAEGHYDRLPALAADLVSRRVDVIAAGNFPAALATKNATSTIPIVFIVGGDPVGDRLVTSLARPGGNLTGIAFLNVELAQKRVELISELVPQARLIGYLLNPNNSAIESNIASAREAAAAKGLRLEILKAGTESEIDAVFPTLVQHVDALLVADPLFDSRREQIVALAARYRIPAIYTWREYVAAGGLISYGTSLAAVFYQAGIYAGRILNGVKPVDLPVQQPTRFELVVSLKTAQSLGLTVPPSVLARADEVIE
jgi:putative tryptophan/tyrosine transport system substrate-binding protein